MKPTLVSILSLLEHASRDVAVHVMGHRLSGDAVEERAPPEFEKVDVLEIIPRDPFPGAYAPTLRTSKGIR